MKINNRTLIEISNYLSGLFDITISRESILGMTNDITKIVEKNYYDFDDYIRDARRTVSIDKATLEHGIIGVSTEAGELLDILKKNKYYDKPIDVINLREEIGDLFWYIALIIDETNSDFREIMIANTNKLRIRYPDKFTNDNALTRNLDKERKGLENDLE